MNGLGVRVAKGLNRVMGRSGKVLDERYHGHILRTPTEVRNARVRILTTNAERHFGVEGRRIRMRRGGRWCSRRRS